ncbi:MAG: NADAR family protein, partial [Candidatus Thiodiazotropha sp.]
MIIPAAAIFNPDGPLWSWSNFAIYRLSFEGISYPSLEHYFQASKFSNTSTLDAIRQSATPAEAKALGWKFDSEKRLDWETVRYMIMKKAIKTKCSQWNRFRQQLISSYPFPIIESNVADPVWGIGEDFMGQNLWGKCAMEIRAELLHLATPNSNIQISTHTRFDKQSNWILFRGSDWSVAPAIVADESLILTEIGVMARDIVELVEQYLSRHRTSVKIPRWSNEPHYLYNSGTLRLDRDSKVQISRK